MSHCANVIALPFVDNFVRYLVSCVTWLVHPMCVFDAFLCEMEPFGFEHEFDDGALCQCFADIHGDVALDVHVCQMVDAMPDGFTITLIDTRA